MNKNKLLKHLIVLILFVSISFLVGCTVSSTTTSSEGLSYANFSSLRVSDPSMQLNMSDEPYYLYYYSESCDHCNLIKEDFLTALLSIHSDHVFLVETNSTADIAIGISVTETPSLVYVVDHQEEEIYVGKTDVMNIIRSLT